MPRGDKNRKKRIECECHVCMVRWCSLDHRGVRKTCSQECRHRLSGLTQMDPTAPHSGHKHLNPFAPPRVSVMARLTGVPFATARGILGGQARMRKATAKQRTAMGKKGGRAAMAKRSPEQRTAIARKAAARTNHVRWGTPLPEWAK